MVVKVGINGFGKSHFSLLSSVYLETFGYCVMILSNPIVEVP